MFHWLLEATISWVALLNSIKSDKCDTVSSKHESLLLYGQEEEHFAESNVLQLRRVFDRIDTKGHGFIRKQDIKRSLDEDEDVIPILFYL